MITVSQSIGEMPTICNETVNNYNLPFKLFVKNIFLVSAWFGGNYGRPIITADKEIGVVKVVFLINNTYNDHKPRNHIEKF